MGLEFPLPAMSPKTGVNINEPFLAIMKKLIDHRLEIRD